LKKRQQVRLPGVFPEGFQSVNAPCFAESHKSARK
jgi:hypothetical protein